MKILKKRIVLILFILLAVNISAQEIEHQAPTLQVGLDGLNFTKGTLDPEVIARIIAEKQSEIKIKVIQNSFLKKIYGSGGTIYNYADNIIKGVLEEPDTDIRTRKIMESTVNLVFVYAFADFYLKKSATDSDIKSKLQALAIGYDLDSLKDFSRGLKYKGLLANYNDSILKSNKNVYEGLSTKESTNKIKNNLNNFVSLIIDISSEVIRDNEKLSDLGLMRVSYSNNYDYLNMFNIQKKYYEYYKDENAIYNKDNLAYSKAIYDSMNTFLRNYTSTIGALKYILEKSNFKSNSIDKVYFNGQADFSLNQESKFFLDEIESDSANNLSITQYDSTIVNLRNSIEELSKKLTNANKQSNENIRENYIKDLETGIKKLSSVLNYLKKIKIFLNDINIKPEDKFLMFSDMLYSLKNEIIPNIEYSVKYFPDLIESKDFIDDLSKKLYVSFTENSNFKFLKNLNKNPEPFVNLVSKLYEFDKTKTFSEYVNIISLLDEVFETGKYKSALATLNTFVKDYTEITKDSNGNEVLIFNVESFLVKLDKMQTDKINRFQFHFTVGMNTTSFVNGAIDLGNGESISNFSHFSEKIGLKIKLVNRGDWLPRNPGETYGSFGKFYTKTSPPKEPLISNWHILVYGSGILYNLINSSTNKEFNFPMAGVGTGVTFFNALDFNVSVGIPLLEKGGFTAMKNNAFVSFGFDIQIAEYFKELGKKRRERKRNEQLTTKK